MHTRSCCDSLFPAERERHPSKADSSEEVVVKAHDGSDQQSRTACHLGAADTVCCHPVAGIRATEQKASAQVGQLSRQRPRFRPTASGPLEAFAHGIERIPALLVFGMQIVL